MSERETDEQTADGHRNTGRNVRRGQTKRKEDPCISSKS